MRGFRAGPDAAGHGFRLGDVLDLRRWALGVLAGAPPHPAPCGGAACWEVFLRAERCGHPLRQALARAGVALPAGADEVLRARAREELKRLLSAAAQIRLLQQVSRATGRRLVVLKGGVLAVDTARGVDVADLDVLLAPDDARALAAHLERGNGYAAAHRDPEPDAGLSHLAQRLSEHNVLLEIHERLDAVGPAEALLDRAVPLQGAPGLLRLAPADQLSHLLHHVSRQHPERLGSVRELLLLADAVRECAGACTGGAAAESRMLRMARALAEGAVPDDAFAAQAASRYLLIRYLNAFRGSSVFVDLSGALVTLSAGTGEYLALWGQTLQRPVSTAPRLRSRALRRLLVAAAPPLRGARLLAATLAVAPLVPWARAAGAPRS